MIRRFAFVLALASYGIVAVGGQGLHLLMHDHGDGDDHEPSLSGTLDAASPAASHSHDDCDHDSEHCAVCQYHSLGQLFIATPPAQVVLGVCELLDSIAPEVVVSPALFSPAQPRAPPMA